MQEICTWSFARNQAKWKICTLRNEKSVLCEMENLYFAKLNAVSRPSRNREFIDIETQCNLTLRWSAGYVTEGVIDFAFFLLQSFYNHGGRFIQDQYRVQ